MKQETRVVWQSWHHPNFLRLAATPLLTLLLVWPLLGRAAESADWAGSWATAPFAQTNPLQTPDFANSTLRQIVHISLAGKAVRIRFTNEFGTEPLTISAAHVGLSAGKGAIQPGTDREVTFNGKPSVSIPVGSIVLSDPVSLDVPALSDLAISTYLPAQQISVPTFHSGAFQTNYVQSGNEAGTTSLSSPTPVKSWFFLRGVDIIPTTSKAGVIVAFGDSITDGACSTSDTNQRWPDLLAQRLQSNEKTSHLAVLNVGIGGNRVLHDTTGPNALARFDHDVLAQAGVKYVVVLEGINDIGRLARNNDPIDLITAEDLELGLQQLATRAHEHKLKIFAATILPYKGAGYYSEKGEAIRQAVNKWIRTSGVFDGVVDFDKAMQDPANSQALLPRYDCRDHLHPSDAGYKAMADTVDLTIF